MGKKAFMLLIAVLLAFGIVFPALADEDKSPDMSSLEEIHDYIKNNSIEKKDDRVLIRGAIEGMLDALEDPYSAYFSPESLDNFNAAVNADYVEIGVILEPAGLYPKVAEVFEKSPAREAGMKPGDLIVKVDGTDVAGEPIAGVVDKIRGPEGTIVRLSVRREGQKDFEAVLKRVSINLATTRVELLRDGTGYIKIVSFGTHTAGEFSQGLKSLQAQGAKDLIIDLRDCPGGLLTVAVKIAGNFVEFGKTVTSIVDRDGEREIYRSDGNAAGKDMRVAVLTNHDSASASEILAGALRDYGIGTIIGATTYGKGSVQAVIPLRSGGALKITTARYFTPKDEVIDGLGLQPDIQVLTPDLQLPAAQGYLHPRGRRSLVFDSSGATATVNGSPVKVANGLFRRGGKIYLPLRFTAEALGFRVDWREEDGRIKVSGDGKEIVFDPVTGKALVAGRETESGPLLIVDGTAYLPAADLTFLGAALKEDGTGTSIEK